MFARSSNPALRRHRLVGLAVGLSLTGCLVGACLALSSGQHGPDGAERPAGSPPQYADGSPASDTNRTSDRRSLAGNSDPEAFASAVARALFDWDTAAAPQLSEHVDQLLTVADPTGAESQGLIADVAAYLPTDEAWAYLKRYYTRQWIEIESVTVPDLWAEALEEAGPGGFAPGTAAYTIEGVRHRTGIWESDDVSSAHDVAFTVFIVCGPTYPSCHLLRLSRLDEPLE